MIELLISRLRKILPDTIFNFFRRILAALITPILFSYKSGHFLSSIQSKAVDKKNNPIPWYTYSCIDFLQTFNFKNKKILEFGSGQSSIWWSKLSQEVHSLEDNYYYEKKISKLKINNLKVYNCDTYSVSYTHLRAHETLMNLVCRLLLEKTGELPRAAWFR